MLFLLFQLGEDRYALDSAGVIEVLPFLTLKELPQAPEGIAGLFDYHGVPVPAIDVSAMLGGAPAPRALSTRIVLVWQPEEGGLDRLLGLIVEKATATARLDPAQFIDGGVKQEDAPALGPVIPNPIGLIQRMEPGKLLSEPVRRALFQQMAEAA